MVYWSVSSSSSEHPDKMDIIKVLACARAILKDDPTGTELATPAVKPTHNPMKKNYVNGSRKADLFPMTNINLGL